MGWFLGFSMDDWWALVLVPFQTLPVTFYLVYQVATLFLSVLLFFYIVCLFCVFGKIPEEVLVGGSLIAIHPTSAFSFSVRVLAPLAALVGCLEAGAPALAPYLRVPVPVFQLDRFFGAFALLLAFHAITFFLYAVLPASSARGYVLEPATGAPAVYRLPGFSLLLVCVVLWVAGVHSGVLPPAQRQWECRVEAAAASFCIGVFFSAAFYWRGVRAEGGFDKRARCPTVDMMAKGGGPLPPPKRAETAEFAVRSPLDHFYCGLSEFNTRVLNVDWKMWLYATGAVQLQLGVLAALAADAALQGAGAPPTLAARCVGGCLTLFVAEYMWHEEVHLYTYDLFRERLGFKLLWGCLCWYPCFYAVPLHAVVGAGGAGLPPAAAWAGVALFLCGWVFTRGANMQKFHLKTKGLAVPFLGGAVPLRAVPGSGGRLVCSGFYGLSRHVNYAGEITQAVALAALATGAGGSWMAWLYPAYYVAIFLPRQQDDDAIMEEKYGKEVWAAYMKEVPWRILPGVY